MAKNATYFSIITMNVADLNSLIKRQRMMSWVKKQDPMIKIKIYITLC
jgi:hypothetical protein